MQTTLLSEIESYLAEAKIGEHRFGILAVRNGRLVERLRAGRRIWPDTEERVRQFMRSQATSSHPRIPSEKESA